VHELFVRTDKGLSVPNGGIGQRGPQQGLTLDMGASAEAQRGPSAASSPDRPYPEAGRNSLRGVEDQDGDVTALLRKS
jgi:hypothetical protein